MHYDLIETKTKRLEFWKGTVKTIRFNLVYSRIIAWFIIASLFLFLFLDIFFKFCSQIKNIVDGIFLIVLFLIIVFQIVINFLVAIDKKPHNKRKNIKNNLVSDLEKDLKKEKKDST